LCAFRRRAAWTRRQFNQRLAKTRLNFLLDDDASEMQFHQMANELAGERGDQFMTD
jgi:hypothetical protein